MSRQTRADVAAAEAKRAAAQVRLDERRQRERAEQRIEVRRAEARAARAIPRTKVVVTPSPKRAPEPPPKRTAAPSPRPKVVAVARARAKPSRPTADKPAPVPKPRAAPARPAPAKAAATTPAPSPEPAAKSAREPRPPTRWRQAAHQAPTERPIASKPPRTSRQAARPATTRRLRANRAAPARRVQSTRAATARRVTAAPQPKPLARRRPAAPPPKPTATRTSRPRSAERATPAATPRTQPTPALRRRTTTRTPLAARRRRTSTTAARVVRRATIATPPPSQLASALLPQAVLTLPGLEPIAQPQPSGLPWLRTSGNHVIDDSAPPQTVYLRGITLVNADSTPPGPNGSLHEALGLDDHGLDILAAWGVNLVRLVLTVDAVLTGTPHFSTAEFRAELDRLVSAAASIGAYTLLALEPSGSNADVLRSNEILADRFRDESAVLFEPVALHTPLPQDWPRNALILIGAIRALNPAALVCLSSRDALGVQDLPFRFATGDPVHNLVYVFDAEPGRRPSGEDPTFESFARSFPVFVRWGDGGSDFGRASEASAWLLQRLGASWSASAWNVAGALVREAPQDDFAETRFGRIVRRALVAPNPPVLEPTWR